MPFSATAFNWSCTVIEIVAKFSFILGAESSITLMKSSDNLLITATVERCLRNIDAFVGFRSLQTVLVCSGQTIALARAKCFLCKFTVGSIIASPQPKCGGTETGIKASDFGGINTASTVRNKVSFVLVKLRPTKSS